MNIMFEGQFDEQAAQEHIQRVLRFLEDRYSIRQFRDVQLSLTLLDEKGHEVELVNTETAEVYRVMEVARSGAIILRSKGRPTLRLVV